VRPHSGAVRQNRGEARAEQQKAAGHWFAGQRRQQDRSGRALQAGTGRPVQVIPADMRHARSAGMTMRTCNSLHQPASCAHTRPIKPSQLLSSNTLPLPTPGPSSHTHMRTRGRMHTHLDKGAGLDDVRGVVRIARGGHIHAGAHGQVPAPVGCAQVQAAEFDICGRV